MSLDERVHGSRPATENLGMGLVSETKNFLATKMFNVLRKKEEI